MSAQPKPKWKPGTPVHLEPVDGKARGTYLLIRAAYNDQVEEAQAILKADPGQINLQEPFAGLTALHIAIFRQNQAMVELLASFPGSDPTIRDNFGRLQVDMLTYTAEVGVFDAVIYRSTGQAEM